MHSFHQSRSRIAFEVLCALTVSASCALAWMQIGATAFLPAAVATGLYGMWHLTDMRSPKAEVRVPEIAEGLPQPVEATEREPTVDAEPEAPAKPKKRSRKKAAPVQPISIAPTEMAEPETAPAFPDRAEIEEELHAPIAPLFETKPFAQQQRPTFGRKAG